MPKPGEHKTVQARILRYAEDIHSSAEGLLKLVDETLDLSKIESGGIELREAPVAVSEVVKALETIVQEAAAASLIALEQMPLRSLRRRAETLSVPATPDVLAAISRK